jgi:hypothetical protein
MNMELIDEIRLVVHPVVLGSGKALFKDVDRRHALELTNVGRIASGPVRLTYRRAEVVATMDLSRAMEDVDRDVPETLSPRGKELVDGALAVFERFYRTGRERVRVLGIVNSSLFERMLSGFGPLLVAIALALRFTKVSGEVRLERAFGTGRAFIPSAKRGPQGSGTRGTSARAPTPPRCTELRSRSGPR